MSVAAPPRQRPSAPRRFWNSPVNREVLLASALALVLTILTIVYLPSSIPESQKLMVPLLILAVVGELVYVTVRHGELKEAITLFEPVLAASVLLMPPWFSLIMAVVGVVAAGVLHRVPIIKTVFNMSVYVASAAAFVFTYNLVISQEDMFSATEAGVITPLALVGLVLGGLFYTAVNNYLLFRILTLMSGGSIRENLQRSLPLAWVSVLSSVAIGAVMVVIYHSAPVLLPLVFLAGGALLYGHMSTTRAEREGDRTAQMAALAEIIAQEGSAPDMLESFLELVRRTFNADVAMVVLEGDPVSVMENLDGTFSERPAEVSDRALLGMEVVRTGAVMMVHETPSPWANAIVVPMEEDARRLGMVMVASRDRNPSLTPESAALLSSLLSSLVSAQRNTSLSQHIQAITSSQAEAVVALDDLGRVTFMNPAAKELLCCADLDVSLMSYREVFGLEQEGVPVDLLEVTVTGERMTGEGARLRVGESRIPVHYTASPIRSYVRGVSSRYGLVLAMADMAEQTRAQERLLQSQERLVEAGRTLQRSLLPPLLPDLPGSQVAAAYHAGADGLEVGGDFYDVFDVLEDSWMVVIGDVCGRGAEAAALTALTRHTLRAAAMRESAPSQLLMTLNEAILRHHGDDRFCTVAAAHLRLGDSPSVRVSCAGHPSPYVVRTDGTVEEVGPQGTLLGILPTIEVSELEFPLSKGDLLVFYTDGVTEARNAAGEQFGEKELVPFLERCAHLPADEVTRRLDTALEQFRGGPPDDDTAFLVIAV